MKRLTVKRWHVNGPRHDKFKLSGIVKNIESTFQIQLQKSNKTKGKKMSGVWSLLLTVQNGNKRNQRDIEGFTLKYVITISLKVLVGKMKLNRFRRVWVMGNESISILSDSHVYRNTFF